MMGLTLRRFVQTLTLRAAQTGKTPAEVARDLALGQFETSVEQGRTVIRTSEAGGNTEFALPEGLTPTEIIDLAGRALEWIEAQPNPREPGLPALGRRLRFTFDRARL